jgi:type II secretory pathway pseudopilin PulG
MKSNKKSTNERGFVSIIVTIMVMAIVTIIVVSFAFLMRREQRQALDKQLSTQAFYAAESGVNDAIHALKSNPNLTINNCKDTDDLAPYVQNWNNQLDPLKKVEYTCVLINPAPDSLEYNPIDDNTSTIVPLRTANGSNITNITISWHDYDESGNPSTIFANNTDHRLPKKGTADSGYDVSPTGTGILRTTLMPIRPGATKQNLIDDAQTLFLYPMQNATPGQMGQINYNPSPVSNEQGAFVDGQCNQGSSPRFCNVHINNLGSASTNFIYLRMKAIYNRVAVTISINDGTPIIGAQTMVDATGKAQDTLRRVQVRVPLNNSFSAPEFALESLDSICKRLNILPTTLSSIDPLGADRTTATAADPCSIR